MVRATGERSPAHARNVGAGARARDWILFLDADCRPPAGCSTRTSPRRSPTTSARWPARWCRRPAGDTLAARYGAARSFLSQQAHLAHPYRPRAVAANLLVRRAAFEQVGGFYEGVRAAEDTDFSWRLQQAGWRLELRRGAQVEHRYRATAARAAPPVARLRRRPRVARAPLRGIRARAGRGAGGWAPEARPRPRSRPRAGRSGRGRRAARAALRRVRRGRLERGRYLALDALLAVEELAGFALSNRPARSPARAAAEVVLVADRFPVRGDPLVESRALERRPGRGRGPARVLDVEARPRARDRLPRGRRPRRRASARSLALTCATRCASPLTWCPRGRASRRLRRWRPPCCGCERDRRALGSTRWAARRSGRPRGGSRGWPGARWTRRPLPLMRVHVVDPVGVHAPLRPRAVARRSRAGRRRGRADHERVRLRRGARARRLRGRELFYRHARGRRARRPRRAAQAARARPRHAPLPPRGRAGGRRRPLPVAGRAVARPLPAARPADRADRPRPAAARAASGPGAGPAPAVRRGRRGRRPLRVRARGSSSSGSASIRPRCT